MIVNTHLPHIAARARDRADRLALIAAMRTADLELIPVDGYTCLPVRTTAEAVRCLENDYPCLAMIDLELAAVDTIVVCRTARTRACASVLVVASTPTLAPAVIKAGCHSFLLKPLTRNLVAARLGRLARGLGRTGAGRGRDAGTRTPRDTLRTCAQVLCPTCAEPGGVSFEFDSHRRAWYACLTCDGVWLGRRTEA
jgi:CheY-like chemotaxis protein